MKHYQPIVQIEVLPGRDPDMKGHEYIAIIMGRVRGESGLYNTGAVFRGPSRLNVFARAEDYINKNIDSYEFD